MSDITRLEAKVDLVFGLLSNQLLAGQAVEAYQATQGKEDPESIEIAQKSAQAFKMHSKNMMDSLDYYINLFGKEANERLVTKLREAGYSEANTDEEEPQQEPENTQSPEPVAAVKAKGSRKSEKV